MNMHYSGGTAVQAHPQHASGLRYPDSRFVGAQSGRGWLAEGFRIARANPVLWLVAILGCADFVTPLVCALIVLSMYGSYRDIFMER
ncbi:hypothetical protein R75471_05126 [Paraburkholderia domus]|uniref:hypothetical protein n=1 Tax=Paraburkholderia domus TaxID=2793075 RepID=UPI001B2C7E1A|nr:hypothetical protein [Paraburkholderia domus]CAE6937213.1 hypothetical protein R75471_05126 [Paraburkholderia domus]